MRYLARFLCFFAVLSFFAISLQPKNVEAANPTVTFPGKIYKNQSFTIDYQGAQNNGCYVIYITPKPPNSQTPPTPCSGRTKANIPYFDKKVPASGTILIEGLPNTGTYQFSFQQIKYGVSSDRYEQSFTVEENTSGPMIDTIVCVYPQGTNAPSTPPATGCTNTGSFNDSFIISGNTSNMSPSTDLTIWYSNGGPYTSLTNITTDGSGAYSSNISGDIQRITNTSSPTGTINLYVGIIIGSTEYKSGIVQANILNLSTTNPKPAVDRSPPPCAEGLQKTPDGKSLDPTPVTDPKKIVVCTKVRTAIGDIETKPELFVKRIFLIIESISGGIAVLLIIYAGFSLMSSRGNPDKIQNAREVLTSAIVGLLFVIFSILILQFIGVDVLCIPGFTGNSFFRFTRAC